MSNLNLSGKDILRFLVQHYDFVQMAFLSGKPDFVIEQDRFQTLVDEYNTTNDSKITVSKLFDLKFCRQLTSGEYKINGNYSTFLEFIFDDFVLDLPETLKTRYQAIFGNFINLQTEIDENKISLYIQDIVNEVESFLNDIQRQTYRLLRDTESLKVNAENNADLTIRVQKAAYWIDEYIIPLNSVLNKEHPDSIIATIINIQRYASEKRFSVNTFRLKKEFEKLYACVVNANSELDQTIGKLTRELLPLLERIKSDSLILSGFYHFIENIDQPENYIIPLPDLLKKENNSVMSNNFSAVAEFYIDHFNPKNAEVIYLEETEEIEWMPDTSYFKELLLSENGSENFYQWCFDVLQKHTNDIPLSKFFTVSNLILEEDLKAEYLHENRFEIALSDVILKMPKVKVYAISE